LETIIKICRQISDLVKIRQIYRGLRWRPKYFYIVDSDYSIILAQQYKECPLLRFHGNLFICITYCWRVWERRGACRVLCWDLKERNKLEDLGVDGSTILKWIIKK